MADPFWLDSSTIVDIAEGDEALEARVRGLGAPLLMVPKVREDAPRIPVCRLHYGIDHRLRGGVAV